MPGGRRPKDGINRDRMISLRLPENLYAWLIAQATSETLRFDGKKKVSMSDVALRALRRERGRNEL